MILRVYLKQLAFALNEAATSDDPRVIELALSLVERAATWARAYRGRQSAGSSTLVSTRTETVWQGMTQ